MSITDLLKTIQKKYGDGSARLFKDFENIKVERFSTGLPSLDFAMGGGIPEGRIVEIYGMPSCGKCLPKDTLILTEFGYKTIEDIFIENDVVPSCTTKNVTAVNDYFLINRYGKKERIKTFTCNYTRPLNIIKTEGGIEIKSTLNHPHLVLNKNGNYVWRRTSEIEKGDYLCRYRGNIESYKINERDDEAYGLGILVADGYFGKNRISITNNDMSIKDFVMEKFPLMFGFTQPKIYNNGNDFHFNCHTEIEYFYKKYNISNGIAKDKIVPKHIYVSPLMSKISFIRGYVDCEGYFCLKGLEIASASKKLLTGIQLLLAEIGIKSNIKLKIVKGYEQNYYGTLLVTGNNYKKYLDVIGTSSDDRAIQIQNSNYERIVDGTHDIIPNMEETIKDAMDSIITSRADCRLVGTEKLKRTNLSYTKLGQFLSLHTDEFGPIFHKLRDIQTNNYIYDPVESNEYYGEEPTFDFEMEETHSFIANGIITHNTSLAILFLAEVQKAYPNKKVAYIDVEHALDPEYAKVLGLDMDNVVFCQPNSAETTISIMEELCDSGEIKAIVLDSVAQLTPNKELDGETGDAEMGMRARLMSQHLRKIVPIADLRKCTCFYINQIRMTMDKYHPETRPGGKALPFSASIIIKAETKKDKDGITGVTKFDIIKNKVGVPFKSTTIAIEFGKGFDYLQDLITCAIATGTIARAGAFYSFGEKKRQGEEKMRAEITEDKKLQKDIGIALKKLSK